MVPHKITLKNFLSYGEELQTIDFKNYNLICFSGRNGHGKSALLDAMTWALWGQARKITGTIKADDGLLRLGGQRMMVSFEFSFNHRLYRVRREFAKSYGKPQASLDFEIFDDAKQGFVSLTDKTIRATNDKIQHLLGLDFDTFVNSSFIRQGQSNEFSRKSPQDRKQILANILGFSTYDNLQQLALESARQLSDEKKMLMVLQEQAAVEVAKEPELKLARDRDVQALQLFEAEEKKLAEEQLLFEKEQEQLMVKVHQYTLLQKEAAQLDQLIAHKTASLQAVRNAWKSTHKNLLLLPPYELIEQERKLCYDAEAAFRTAQQQALTLQEKQLQKKELYQKIFVQIKEDSEKKLYAQRLACEQKKTELTHHASNLLQLGQRIIEGQKKEQQLVADEQILSLLISTQQEFEKNFEVEKNQFEKRRSYYQMLVQRGNWTKNSLADVQIRRKKLEDTTSAGCPLCEQVLTVKRKEFLAQVIGKEEQFLQRRLHKISGLLKSLKVLLVEQHERIKVATKQQEEQRATTIKFETVKQELLRLAQELKLLLEEQSKQQQAGKLLQTTLDAAQKELQQFEAASEKEINAHPILLPIVQALKQLEAERLLVVYDAAKHAQATAALLQAEEKIKQAHSIAQQALEQGGRKREIIYLCKELKAHKAQQQEFIKKLEAEKQTELALKSAEERKIILKHKLQTVSEQKKNPQQQLVRIEHELARIVLIAQEVAGRQEKIKTIELEVADYTYLAQAFGKNGIQALLIEEAIPEIESEANKLLAKLTDNQVQLFIESLRDLKKGGVKETLDISISDSAGVRPYEMFSGGEAFRIDFALRIAISKLLARRAGTALQTLIIDEGFGSQDDEALSKMMDCLFAIQSDFSRIIIVSHLAEMKDSFPIHFVVEKGATGSQVRVEERG